MKKKKEKYIKKPIDYIYEFTGYDRGTPNAKIPINEVELLMQNYADEKVESYKKQSNVFIEEFLKQHIVIKELRDWYRDKFKAIKI